MLEKVHDVVIVGAGLAGLSAALYLGRARRDVLAVHSGHSMATWEADVQNYLGFPAGISGDELLERGREQAVRYGAKFAKDEIVKIRGQAGQFVLTGKKREYLARRIVLTTGLTHLPPDIPGVRDCLGHSLFFCKDCDGTKVQDRRVVIIGSSDEAAEYALGMLMYSPEIFIATNGEKPRWNKRHARWLEEYEIPFYSEKVNTMEHKGNQITGLGFVGGRHVAVDAAFTVRGDVYHNELAKALGAKLDGEGQVIVNHGMLTSVKGVYAAGCVTPANCQMVIAAGQGARAAQAISRELFLEDLATHKLRRYQAVRVDITKTHRKVAK
jgi:thioredoxin reductase (NADPH)